MARRAPAGAVRYAACALAALLLCSGLASAQTPAASAPARSAAASPPAAGASQSTASAPSTSAGGASAVPAGVSTGSSTPGAAGAAGASTGTATAQAPSANNAPLATPSDASMTAVSAQFLLIGPDAWPFEDDRQAKLLAALQADLGPLAKYTTGKPFKYSITDVRSSSASSAPPGRKLLQALNALVTAQIDTGSINLVSGVRSNLVSDVQSGALLNLCKEQGLQLTSVSLASAIYSTPVKPKPDTRPQLAAGIAVAGCIVFAFVGWIIYLESEKTRSCCGYSWGNKAGLDGKAAQAGKPAKTVAAGHGNTPVATSPHNFDDPPATLAVDGKGEVAMQPQGVATDAPAGTPANGIGRHRLP